MSNVTFNGFSSTALTVANPELALTPVANAVNTLYAPKARELPLPPLTKPKPSANSTWSEWFLNGYVGDFLGWAGEKLAEVGSELFPPFSIRERWQLLDINEYILRQHFTDRLLGDDVNSSPYEALRAYLRHARVLVKAGELSRDQLTLALIALHKQAADAGATWAAVELTKRVQELNGLGQLQSDFREREGQRYQIFGRTRFSTSLELSGLNRVQGYEIKGITPSDYFVSAAGDVDTDGYDDGIIGASKEEEILELSADKSQTQSIASDSTPAVLPRASDNPMVFLPQPRQGGVETNLSKVERFNFAP